MNETWVQLDIRQNKVQNILVKRMLRLSKVLMQNFSHMQLFYLSNLIDGTKFPPIIIFYGPRKSLDKQLDSKNYIIWFNISKNRAFNNKIGFEYWIDNVFLKQIKDIYILSIYQTFYSFQVLTYESNYDVDIQIKFNSQIRGIQYEKLRVSKQQKFQKN
ncbi:DDE superfamily endonuclease (macronuclear) [Tetrahymena thermophila SB210]|uniref:DDE superfamily endonuclease n=1 Tax=Tetrahymena thermophila (strain SB210) TaxID=312017 RepID=W7XDD1_TETTS|nr:DDE superfamily endonuclease [Tetrahymena thermophila SB210]EWS75537.1 DDE superfamily endonuclease [Tetrahymena thermophila SB210]|eukprot:XP_012651933.1 DDE superfamily endonuclease [Tetrahymena thermophila SB210]